MLLKQNLKRKRSVHSRLAVGFLPAPGIDDDLSLFQRIENLSIKQLVSQPGIEALHVAVLPGTSWLDEGGLGTDPGSNRFGKQDFRYAADEDVYICIAGNRSVGRPFSASKIDQPAQIPRSDGVRAMPCHETGKSAKLSNQHRNR